MKTRKSLFGYSGNVSVLKHHSKTDWFDTNAWLTEGISKLQTATSPRMWIVYLLFLGLFTLFSGRLYYLQVQKGNQNRVLADGNRIRREIDVAPRGNILDAKGRHLVTNQVQYQLVIVPADLPYKRSDRETVYDRIASESGLLVGEISAKVNRAGLFSHTPVVLAERLSRDDALRYKLRLADIAGVRVSYVATRNYVTTSGLGHILGYTSRMNESDSAKYPDYPEQAPIGRVGLESSYDHVLRGQVGVTDIEVNATGQFQRIIDRVPPKIGTTLQLSLDLDLQAEMEAALREAMDKEQAKQAVGVAMDPSTGAILASVSLPSYDANLFARGITSQEFEALNSDENKPLLNRAVAGVYPAGSTIKPFVAAAALEEKTITPTTSLDTSAGVIEVAGSRFPDWKRHGVTNVGQAIAESNNIFFYALGGGYKNISPLGIDRLEKYFKLFGFSSVTGIDYAKESIGLIPTPEWKRKAKKESWYLGDTYHVSIGQESLLVTPTQMLRALASLINGGTLVTPHVVTAMQDPQTGSVNPATYPEKKLPLSASSISAVQNGMRLSVELDTGSARSLQALPFRSGGKTGTAQFDNNRRTHAWYIGYAPLDNPKIAVVVLVEGGGEGNAIAVPVAGRVFQKYLIP